MGFCRRIHSRKQSICLAIFRIYFRINRTLIKYPYHDIPNPLNPIWPGISRRFSEETCSDLVQGFCLESLRSFECQGQIISPNDTFFISGKQYSNEFQVTRCGSFYNQPRIYRTSTAVKTARALIYASRRHGFNFKTQKIEFNNLPPSNEVHFWSWSTKWKYGGYLSTFLGVKVLTKSHAVHFERPMTWDYSRYGIHIWCRMNRRWYPMKILMRISTY